MPFVNNGRGALQQRLSSLESRRVGLALGLTGAPGIGKSHTAQQALDRLNLSYLKVRANASDAALASAWLEVLRQRPVSVPDWVSGLLQRLVALEVVPSEAVAQLSGTLMRALAPFVLLVEDAHEASAGQLERWVVLARIENRNSALVVTGRNALPAPFQVIHLDALTLTETAAILEIEAGRPLPAPVVSWVFERSGGNPLFAVEYLRDLQRRGFLAWQGEQTEWRTPDQSLIPNTVEALIEQVIDGLPDERSRAALNAWAMIGEADSSGFWADAADLSPEALRAARDDLERFGVLSGQGFTHALFREITLRRLPGESRRAIARRLIARLEGAAPLQAVRFVHEAGLPVKQANALYRAAIAIERDPTRRARLQAAALEFVIGDERFAWALSAAEVLAPVDTPEAARLAEVAYNIKPDDLEAVNLRARIWVSQGQAERGKDMLQGVAPTDPEARSVTWWQKWCDLLLLAQDFAGAWAVYQEKPAIAEGLSVMSRILLARSLTMQGDYETAETWLRELEGRGDLSLEEQYRITVAKGILLGEYGRIAESAEVIRAAYALVEHLPNSLLKRTALLHRAHTYNWIGRYAEAHEDYVAGIQMMLEAGQVAQAATARMAMSNNWVDRGQYAEAERGFLEARATLEVCQSWRYLTECEYFLVRLYYYWRPLHAPMLVLKHARAAVQHARTTQLRLFIASALFWATQSETVFGQLERAQTLNAELHELTQADGRVYMWQWNQALILERQGWQREALEMLRAGIATRANVAEPDDDRDLMQLEVTRMSSDLEAARVTLEAFRARGFAPGETLCLHYFPALQAFHSEAKTASVALHLNALGSLQVIQDGSELNLRGTKRKLLLALLLETQLAGQPEARSTDLCEALYPNATDEEARAAVKQLVFQLRAQLGTDSLQTTRNGYALGHVESDVKRFLESGDTDLWRGPYLADVQGMEGHALETIHEALYSQLERRAEALLSAEPAESARLARILLEVEPFDTDALALALRALRAQGNYVSIQRMYRRSRETWLEVGERLPDRWTDFLEMPRVA